MITDEFVTLLAEADRKQRGLVVNMTTIHEPPNGLLYGHVTYGLDENKRLFRGTDELLTILRRLAR